jgi:hypothetical protein
MTVINAIVRLADAVTSLADAVKYLAIPANVRDARHYRATREKLARTFEDRGPIQ